MTCIYTKSQITFRMTCVYYTELLLGQKATENKLIIEIKFH